MQKIPALTERTEIFCGLLLLLDLNQQPFD
jgi:hypothetical protein